MPIIYLAIIDRSIDRSRSMMPSFLVSVSSSSSFVDDLSFFLSFVKAFFFSPFSSFLRLLFCPESLPHNIKEKLIKSNNTITTRTNTLRDSKQRGAKKERARLEYYWLK